MAAFIELVVLGGLADGVDDMEEVEAFVAADGLEVLGSLPEKVLSRGAGDLLDSIDDSMESL